MARSTANGYWRQRPTKAATAAVSKLMIRGAFDPTSATQISLGTLPAGAIPLEVTSLGGSTGGTNPTVDIGTAGSVAGLADELLSDTVTFGGAGALTGIALTVDTEVFGKVGASASTGGETTVIVSYIMADDGA